ncbi:MAG: efflux RND transporter periplasmic adaptor subunit [Candidatus Paceibacterota bacterium]
MLHKFFKKIVQHKVIAGIVILSLIGIGIFSYKKLSNNSGATRYIVATVEKGTITSSVSGSGQVSALNQIDLKAKASGEIIYARKVDGVEISKGTLLAQIDSDDAQKSIRDAESSLENAKLALEKLKGPEGLAVPKNKQAAMDDLAKDYEDGFNTVSNVFLELPSIMTGLQSMVFGYNLSPSQWNIDYYANAAATYNEKASFQYRDDAYEKYVAAKKAYDQNFEDYKSTNRYSGTGAIEDLISQTYDTDRLIAEAIKSMNNLIQFYQDELTDHNMTPQTLASTHLSALSGYTSKTNSHLLNLLNIQKTIEDDKDAIENADLDIESQELAVQQKEDALADAKEKLENYFVYAPFTGVATEISVKKGDTVSSGSSIATFMTKQKIAEISLNEVDIAKIKVNQKVNLTFDAIEDLNITGEVGEIDAIGTVSQGVVTYTVKIVFDTQDDRVKPGMSVSAVIITDTRQDVLLVSSSAIKSTNGTSYVEVVDASSLPKETKSVSAVGIVLKTLPKQQQVTVGLSDDTNTEIIEGLKEGDIVVSRTVSSSTKTQQSTSNNVGGGGEMMMLR